MGIAFFDLDRTLISVNAGKLWVESEWRQGFIGRWQVLRAGFWIATYHLGFSRIEGVLEEAIATLEGALEDEIAARTETFYAAEVARTYRRRAREVVEAHRARGDTLALLTSSSVYLAKAVQQELGIEHALCNRFEVVDGIFTGQPVRPLCFGPGKLDHAKQLAEQVGATLEDATFYTDSASDLSVLAVVGNPVAVHPDPALARIARRRGWKIEDWER